ncbi:hypothetical protein CMV_010258 [Castanea mollissima]|uniref:Pentatricopeptide repeat-containing protein n=1 Tax=Castanea mollissima TaxID=60419 RepID=A0A8J4VXZ4_9ROSI|nr:hypothetical protein CMV_010258 [Castanea mollissima]
MVKRPPLKALSLFNSSTLEGLQRSHQSLSFIIDHLLSSKMLPHVQSLIQQVLSGRISSPTFTSSSLLHYLTKTNLSLDSTHVHLYEAIINAHVQCQLTEQALFYFTQMIDKGLVPGPKTFNNLLGFLINSNCFEKAWCLFNETKGKVEMDVYSFGIVIKGCCEAGDLDRGFELLVLLEEMGWSPNVVIYTTLIDGCCKNGDIERAKKLFRKMGELGLVANQYTYTVLINGLFKKGLKKDGFELYEEMEHNGVGKLDKASSLFDHLKLFGQSPTLVTYNVLIAGFCRAGNFVQAADLVRDMEERGISPSKVTYTILIDAIVRSDDMEKAFQIYSSMEKAGLVPDVHTYGVLIHGLCMKGNLKEALKLFKSMSEKHLEPNDVIYNTLILGYCKEGSSYRALGLLKEMGASRLIPNVATYSSTIGVLCKDGKWTEAEVLLKAMIESDMDIEENVKCQDKDMKMLF